MDELASKLKQLLDDPGSMQQIASIAGMLTADSSEDRKEGATSLPAAEMIEGIRQIIQTVGKSDARQDALVEALCPYLKPRRRERLHRAIQIARLSQVAGAALRTQSGDMIGGGRRV